MYDAANHATNVAINASVRLGELHHRMEELAKQLDDRAQAENDDLASVAYYESADMIREALK